MSAQIIRSRATEPASPPGPWADPTLWWPLAPLAQVQAAGRTPLSVMLFGTPWAIVTLDGHIAALKDLCPHRRVPLSAGTVADQAGRQVLECGYHGWAYDRSGQCSSIPALGENRFPTGMGATPTLRVAVAAGYVWGSADPATPGPVGVDGLGIDGARTGGNVVERIVDESAAAVADMLCGPSVQPRSVLTVSLPGAGEGLRIALRPETSDRTVVCMLDAPQSGPVYERRTIFSTLDT